MELIRDKDVIFEDSNLENLFKLENFPVFMGCMDNLNPQDDLYEDFILDISKTNGIVQVRNLIQLEVLYDAEHSSGTVGKIWHDHHKAFADFMSLSTNPKRVFEIGGLHGILSKYYNQNNEISSWTIVEPNPIPVDGCPANFIEGFFGNDFELDEEFDAYVHSHTLEHIYKPVEFAKKLSEFIPEGKDLFFSIPNIEEMIKRKYTNAINFEHTFFLTTELAIYLMESNGFKLITREKFMDDHSMFYHFKKITKKKVDIKNFENKYDDNKKLFKEWFDHHKNEAENLLRQIQETNSPVFLFGAHIFSQTLLNFGLDEDHISCILDNDDKKHNKRLYGTNLIVKSPDILRDQHEPMIILRAGVYNNEIKEQILRINPSAIII